MPNAFQDSSGFPSSGGRSNRVTALLTTYNRKEQTLRCLESLYEAHSRTTVELQVVIADAASADGTKEAVLEKYPEILLIPVSSDTFWAQGMRRAWEAAKGLAPSDILWLNDDVVLSTDSLVIVEAALSASQHKAIIVGAFEDPETGEPTYSGSLLGSGWKRLSMKPVHPNGTFSPIDAANGNLVWVPQEVDALLGGFPKGYIHGMADHAFTLEARKRGIPTFLTDKFVGSCSRNAVQGTWQDTALSPQKRLSLLKSPKGLPFRQYWRFCTEYGGILGPLYAIKPYAMLCSMAAVQCIRSALGRPRRP